MPENGREGETMEITQYYLTENRCYKAGKRMTPKGIVVHSTGANNPNLCRYIGPDDGVIGPNKYGNHWNQASSSKCVHAMIGKDKTGTVRCYQTLPWNYQPWGCGSGSKGSYNSSHIQELLCKGWFLPPNTYDCGSFVVNETAVVGKEQNNPYNH